MKLTLHSPAEGKQPGETVDVPESRGEWLVQNGYAVAGNGEDEEFGRYATTTTPDKDPTLAENREAPGQDFKDKTEKPKSKSKKAPEEEPQAEKA